MFSYKLYIYIYILWLQETATGTCKCHIIDLQLGVYDAVNSNGCYFIYEQCSELYVGNHARN